MTMITTNVIIPATIFNLLEEKAEFDALGPLYLNGSLSGIPLALLFLKGFLMELLF
jgi:hypothetical protein